MDGHSTPQSRRDLLKASFAVRESYHPSERMQVIRAFRIWRAQAEHALAYDLSASTIEAMIDESFSRYHGWLSDRHSPNFKTVFNDRLDPKTIRRLLTCEVSYRSVRTFQASTIRLIDGFLQVMQLDPLPYLREGDGLSRDPSSP